ncbi:hypothetical protein [Sphingobacterium siyangense]|uniref:hypothetical protein n=1 Tax=Sphingobacterium siyangense TaxID=459529 RepID=UPI0031F98560
MMKKIILLLLLGCGTVSTKAQELPGKSTIVRSKQCNHNLYNLKYTPSSETKEEY